MVWKSHKTQTPRPTIIYLVWHKEKNSIPAGCCNVHTEYHFAECSLMVSLHNMGISFKLMRKADIFSQEENITFRIFLLSQVLFLTRSRISMMHHEFAVH